MGHVLIKAAPVPSFPTCLQTTHCMSLFVPVFPPSGRPHLSVSTHRTPHIHPFPLGPTPIPACFLTAACTHTSGAATNPSNLPTYQPIRPYPTMS